MSDPIIDALEMMTKSDFFVSAIFSGKRRNMQPDAEKIEFRPIKMNNVLKIQMTAVGGGKSKSTNLSFGDPQIESLLKSGYANCLVKSTDQTLTLRFTKKGDALGHYEKQVNVQSTSHDRQKQRLLDPSSDFLRLVGISDSQGRIKPTMNNKYQQIEEFLRILMPTLNSEISSGRISENSKNHPLRIVDHGCGNAYLTFAVHSYLSEVGFPNSIVGIDQREESRLRNQRIANDLGVNESVSFKAEKISDTDAQNADIAIALHACNTATDDALAWAVENQAKIILVSPCCHHDLQVQLTNIPDPWQQVTKHGILKQRLGDILTDALRAQILRIKGYRTDIIEFIGDDHTPRNLMIRAVLTRAEPDPIDRAIYEKMLKDWSISPKLAELIKF